MTVKIYSTPSCPFCHKAKQFFKEHNVKFKDIDVAQDQKAAEEMIELSGQTGVPVVVIDKTIIVGYSPEEMKKALKIK